MTLMIEEYGTVIASPGLMDDAAFLDTVVRPGVSSLDNGAPKREVLGGDDGELDGRAGAGAGSDLLKSFEKAPNMCDEQRKQTASQR
jgi:hypothetical protein